MNITVILAGGMGKRMGAGKNKVLLELQKKPIIFHTISAFEKSPLIDGILLVCKDGEQAYFTSLCQKHGFKKIIDFIAGGKERQDSALNGITYLDSVLSDKKKSLILFHNGANPFVSEEEITAVIQNAKKFGASAVAHPTKDTIKEADEKGLVEKTLERKKLWNMQTPQAIQFDLARKAFSQAAKDNFIGTDDVSLVERLGKKVKLIEASAYNFKITTPLDLELAKIIIKKKYV